MANELRSLFRLIVGFYNYCLLIATIAIWALLLYLPNGIIPDWMNLTPAIKSGAYARIALSYLSLFSLLITILVLTFSLLREKFRRLAVRELLENRYLKLLMTSFIAILIVNTGSAIYIEGHAFSHASLNISYFSLVLSELLFSL